MKKQAYISPELSCIHAGGASMIASSIRRADGNADFEYCGASDEAARVKEDNGGFWEE